MGTMIPLYREGECYQYEIFVEVLCVKAKFYKITLSDTIETCNKRNCMCYNTFLIFWMCIINRHNKHISIICNKSFTIPPSDLLTLIFN